MRCFISIAFHLCFRVCY